MKYSYERYYRYLSQGYDRDIKYFIADILSFSIHDFRTGIKKLLVFYRFLLFAFPELDFGDDTATLKKVFKATGKWRDMQMTLDRVSQLKLGHKKELREALMTLLVTKVKEATDEFREFLQNNPQPKLYNEGIHVLTEERMKNKMVLEFLEQLESEIYEAWAKPRTKKQLHAIRKINKEYINSAKFRFEPIVRISKFSRAEHALGKWHDLLIAAKVVKKIMKENTLHGIEHIYSILKKEEKERRKKLQDMEITS